MFYTGECITPDFNECDYAIGFDYLDFGDRYIRVPLYRLFSYKEDYENALSITVDEHEWEKRGFCSFVCSNDRGMHERLEFFKLLQKYQKVASGGRYLNNVGGPVADKIEFQRNYKFSIAFENCVNPGYTTEKIVQAFASGSIPIYYGNPLINREFNPKSFINCHDYEKFDQVLERVIFLNEHPEECHRMLTEKIFIDSDDDYELLEKFLFNIVEQDYMKAKRIPDNSLIKKRHEDESILKTIDIFYLRPKRKMQSFIARLMNKTL